MHNLLQSFAKILIAPVIFVASLAGYHFDNQASTPIQNVQTQQTLGGFNPSGGATYRIKTSLGSSATTITLSSFKEPVSNSLYTMSLLNSDIGYGTLDPQTSSREFISFTGITQNGDGSATLTGVSRGLSPSYPYTASSTYRQPHSGQSIFILSDAPGLFYEYVTKRNNETISGTKTFLATNPPALSTNPDFSLLATTTLATTGFVASTSYAGTVNASETVKGIAELALNSEAASSTSSGSTGARLVLPASIASSTGASGSAVVPVTQPNGKLAPDFIDGTGNYALSGTNTFTGLNTFSTATTTFSATTSIAASTAAPLFLNSVKYVAPSSQGTASTTISNDGSGNLTWQAAQGYSFNQGSFNCDGSLGTVTLAHTLGVIPKMVKVLTTGSFTNHTHFSSGTATTTASQKSTYLGQGTGPGAGQDGSTVIYMKDQSSNNCWGNISVMTATSTTINFGTDTFSGTNNIYFQVEFFR